MPSISRYDVVRDCDGFERAAERELARVQKKGAALLDCHLFHDVVGGLHNVDVGPPTVAEHEYLLVQPDIHAGRLNGVRPKRIDNDSPLL